MKILLILILFNVSSTTYANPQIVDSLFINQSWDNSNGLPVNSLSDMLLDSKGFLWIATFDGLIRFNGTRFLRFSTDNQPHLRTNRFIKLFEQNNGNIIFLAQNNDIYVYDYKDFRISRIFIDNSNQDIFITGIHQLADKSIFLTTDNGILEVSNTDEIKAYLPNIIQGKCYSIVQDQFKTIWVQKENGNILRIDNNKTQSIQLSNASASIGIYLAEKEGKSFVAINNSMILVTPSDFKVIDLSNQLKDVSITSIFFNNKKDNLLIGTYSNGIFGVDLIDKSKLQVTELIGNTTKSIQLNHSSIGSLLVTTNSIYDSNMNLIYSNPEIKIIDAEVSQDGSIWLGTDGQGLIRLKKNRFKTHQIVNNHNAVSNNLFSVIEDNDSTLWLGTFADGIYKVQKNNQVNRFLNQRELNNSFNHNLYLDKDQHIWLISDSQLGTIDNFGDFKFFSNPFEKEIILHSLFIDFNNNSWLSTSNGLFLSNSENIFDDYQKVTSIPSSSFKFVFQSPDSMYWVSTINKGLYFGKDLSSMKKVNLNGFTSNLTVRSITLDKSKQIASYYRLWCATETLGLLIIDKNKESFEFNTISKKDGFPVSTIHAIVEDKTDRLWISSNSGLFNFNKSAIDSYLANQSEKLIPLLFTTDDGLPNNEFNGNSSKNGILRKNGNIVFANQKGAVEFNPNDFKIDSLSDYFEIEYIHAKDSIYYLNANNINIPYEANKIYVHFNYTNFNENEKFIRYKLNPVITDWVYQNQNEDNIEFIGLNSGNYRLVIEYTNHLGNWNRSKMIKFTILPKWYNSPWFYILTGISLVSLSLTFYFLRYKRLQQKSIQLEKLIKNKTEELNQEKERLQNKNHSLIESLDNKNKLITNLVDEINQPLKEISSTLNLLNDHSIYTNSDLLKQYLINSLQSLKSINNTFSSFNEIHQLQLSENEIFARPFTIEDILSKVVSNFSSLYNNSTVFYSNYSDSETILFIDPSHFQNSLLKLLEYITNLILQELSEISPQITIETKLNEMNQFEIILKIFHPIQTISSLISGLCNQALELDDHSKPINRARTLYFIFELIQANFFKINIVTNNYNTFDIVLIHINSNTIYEYNQFNHKLSQFESRNNSDLISIKPVILCIDSFEPFRLLVNEILKPYYTIIDFSSANDTLNWLSNSIPVLILMDYNLPDMDGIDLTKKIKSQMLLNSVPILMISGQKSDVIKKRALECGVSAFISKPVSPQQLKLYVDQLIQNNFVAFTETESSNNDLKPEIDDNTNSLSSLSLNKLSTSDIEFFDQSIQFIDKNLSNPSFNVEELALLLNTDRTSLFRKFKRITNSSPSSFIQNKRVEKAMELLKQKQVSISDIAFECGYNSLSYFSQAFKNQTGLSPTEWLQQENNETES